MPFFLKIEAKIDYLLQIEEEEKFQQEIIDLQKDN